MATYNKYYQKENYFGQAYPELIAYFSNLDKNLKVLDIGCGQGRDTLALGRLGFHVLGIDISSVGINQLKERALKEKLHVDAQVIDYKDFKAFKDFDVLLLDSMFHFYKKDLAYETSLLVMLLNEMKPGASMMIIVQKSTYRVNKLREIINQKQLNMEIIDEKSFMYQEFNSEFFMLAAKKI